MSCDIAYRWNLKRTVQMNLFTKQKWSHRHRKQTYGYRGDRGRDRLEIGIDPYTQCMYIAQ